MKAALTLDQAIELARAFCARVCGRGLLVWELLQCGADEARGHFVVQCMSHCADLEKRTFEIRISIAERKVVHMRLLGETHG